MSNVNVGSWLRREPQPAKVRLDGKDVVKVGTNKNRWKDVVDVIEESQPTKIEALNEDGDVLRLTKLDYPDGGAGAGDAESSKKKSDLAEFASLLRQAQKDGIDALKEAFDKQAELLRLVFDRWTGVEDAWRQTIASNGAPDADAAKGPIEEMIKTAVTAHVASTMNGAETPAPKTNGKATNGKAAPAPSRK